MNSGSQSCIVPRNRWQSSSGGISALLSTFTASLPKRIATIFDRTVMSLLIGAPQRRRNRE
jgi:hypothetical protein